MVSTKINPIIDRQDFLYIYFLLDIKYYKLHPYYYYQTRAETSCPDISGTKCLTEAG